MKILSEFLGRNINMVYVITRLLSVVLSHRVHLNIRHPTSLLSIVSTKLNITHTAVESSIQLVAVETLQGKPSAGRVVPSKT